MGTVVKNLHAVYKADRFVVQFPTEQVEKCGKACGAKSKPFLSVEPIRHWEDLSAGIITTALPSLSSDGQVFTSLPPWQTVRQTLSENSSTV